MFKSTRIMWAVAALLAVTAVPVLAKKAHHKPMVTHSHRITSLTARRYHRTLTSKHHHSTLLAARSVRGHRSLTSHRGIHRHALTSASHFQVHVTKMPPTIDGIRS
jgi:hypothetical protein